MCPQLRERAIQLLKQEMLKCEDVPFTNTSVAANTLISSSPSSSILSPTTSTSCSSSTSTAPCSSSITSASYSTSMSLTNSSSARKKILIEIFDKPHVVLEKTSVERELENYLTSTSVVQNEEEDDILAYWKEQQKLFPLIALTARHVLTIPASNTSVERLFSSCTNTTTDKRTRLGADKLNKIMFLQKNMNVLQNKSSVNVTGTHDHEDAKRINNETNVNHESMHEILKQYDHVTNHYNDDDYLVNMDSDDDE
ncbi:unnamed protein product [Rotaria socialis]|uniref:HAT C-terminal dimerisation domain-containing protein n=2 Tax=Rotaria socialis TaxID=392032 RepID=A0A818T331_9BILA|nr:unnamed protein product [Rotaria socialis]